MFGEGKANFPRNNSKPHLWLVAKFLFFFRDGLSKHKILGEPPTFCNQCMPLIGTKWWPKSSGCKHSVS